MGAEPWQEKISRSTYERHLKDHKKLSREIQAILRDGAWEAERMVNRLGRYDDFPSDIRRAQYQQSLRAIRLLQRDIWGEVDKVTVRAMNRAIDLGATGTRRLDQFLASAMKGKRGEVFTNFVSGNTFNVAARNSVFHVTSRLKNNIDLSRLVYKHEFLSTGKVAQQINRGLLLNRSAKEIAQSVRNYIHPRTPGGQSYAAMRLGRTEINNAFHRTTIEAGREQPWVEGFKWHTSRSHKIPDPCNELAAQDVDDLGAGIYAPGNVPDKPHPQCMCYITTITLESDEFINRLARGDYNNWMGHWS